MKKIFVFAISIHLFFFAACSSSSPESQADEMKITQTPDIVIITPTVLITSVPTATQTPTRESTATPTIEASSTTVPATSEAIQESLMFVLIEKQQPAYTVYFGIPENMEEENLEEIKIIASEEESVQLISWEDFEGIDLTSEIILNEYENPEVGEGIVELIQIYPMTPFGLTWNGGIAFTFNDYQYAADIYQQYQSDPDKYLQTNERDLREDPINPQNHLDPLLGG